MENGKMIECLVKEFSFLMMVKKLKENSKMTIKSKNFFVYNLIFFLFLLKFSVLSTFYNK